MMSNRIKQTNAPPWDPEVYERFSHERSRPFFDLIAAIPRGDVNTVADLGCGTGELTAHLIERWPQATVWGVDLSVDMLSEANRHCGSNRAQFVESSIESWNPTVTLDRVIANASFHWVQDHKALLERLTGFLGPGGAIAFQVPNNRDQPVYGLIETLMAEPAWRDKVDEDALDITVESPQWYAETLEDLGFTTRVWETIYYHRMSNSDDIIDWVRGSTLRPLLSTLSEKQAIAFVDELKSRFRSSMAVYFGPVIFPFRRIFVVAQRADDGLGG